jgi:putative flippase GtrA
VTVPRSTSTRAEPSTIRALLGSQQFAFLLVGGANLVIGMCCFALLHLLIGDRIGYMGTLVLAYAAAILFAFWLHRRFVFQVRGRIWTDLARFTLVQLGSVALNAAVLPLLVEAGGLQVIPAQMLSLVVVVVFSYFGHQMFSFRRPNDRTEAQRTGVSG